MDFALFLFFMFGLQFFYWMIGKRASKELNNQEDYYLAGRGVPFLPLMLTFLATQVGGGTVLGAAEEAYRYGWLVMLYPLGAALGLIGLGCGIGRALASFKVTTVAQILEVVYGSKYLRQYASLLSVLSLFMILVGQIIASHKFLVSLGIINTPLFILFWGIVIVYTVQGGLKAVIATDCAQAAVFSSIFFVVFAFVWWTVPDLPSVSVPTGEELEIVSPKLVGWLLMPLLFMFIEQDMGQRCFAATSRQVVSKSSLCAGIGTLLVCVVPVFLGCYAREQGLEVPPGGSALMTGVAAATNPWLAALAGCAVLAAIISTATSLINAISSNLSSDFELSRLTQANPLSVSKGITALISIGAIFSAFAFDNIVDLLIQSYELSVFSLFVPIAFGLWRKRGHAPSAMLSMAFGTTGFFIFQFVPAPLSKEIICIALSLLGYGCGELWTLASKVYFQEVSYETIEMQRTSHEQ